MSTLTAHHPRVNLLLPLAGDLKSGGSHSSSVDDNNVHTCLLGFHKPKSTSHISRLSAAEAGELVHRRSHMGSVKIRGASIASVDAPQNLNKYKGDSATTCPHCALVQIKKVSHGNTLHTPAARPGKLHIDLKGPLIKSIQGYQYIAFFIDEHTRYVWELWVVLVVGTRCMGDKRPI